MSKKVSVFHNKKPSMRTYIIALVAVLGVYGPGYSATQFLYGQF